MSAPVDVLAVMDADGRAVVLLSDEYYDAGKSNLAEKWSDHLSVHDESRAAVAELIEAIKPLAALDLRPDGFERRGDSQPVYARGNTVITVGDVRRASAALARVQGGAA